MVTANAEKQAYWRNVLRRQRESGLSVRQFCRDQGLSQSSYYSWKRKLSNRERRTDAGGERNGQGSSPAKNDTAQNENAAVFIPVRLNAAAGGVLEVVHPRGHVVRVPAVFDENSLRQVLHVLDGRGDA